MVESTALEMRRAREGTQGSNPCLSATSQKWIKIPARAASALADYFDKAGLQPDYAVLLFDLVHFKTVNDAHGHLSQRCAGGLT